MGPYLVVNAQNVEPLSAQPRSNVLASGPAKAYPHESGRILEVVVRRRMIGLGVIVKILGYVAWVIVAGALLAPPLYELVRGWIEAGYMVEIAHYRFPKYLNRAVLVVALVGLYCIYRQLKAG